MLSPASNSRSIGLRRNGRPQACEPCRKRKMACDHTIPVCQRCRKRKQESECVYLPSPMTRKSPTASEEAIRSPKTSASNPSPRVVKEAPKDLESAPRSSTLFSTPSGYLGPTSFSSVFWENQKSLDTVGAGFQHLSDSVQESTTAEIESLLRFPVRTARKVITRIPSQHCCDVLVEAQTRWLNIGSSHCHEMLWKTHGHLLRQRTDKSFDELAHVLHQNTKMPFREPEYSQAYLNGFTGTNIRWEALGMLFVSWAYGAMSPIIPESLFTSADGHTKTRKQFLLEMKNSADFCVQLCNETDMVNPIFVIFLYNFGLLTSIFMGDTSVHLWRLHGDIVCSATALGLHRESPSQHSKISLALETRRRAHCGIFAIDKALASFTGRPPMLSRRFCTAVPPLDVSDEDLMLPHDKLMQVVATLDQNGWNTKGEIYPATRMRINYFTGVIKDEILELSLGTIEVPVERQLDQILDLKQRALALYETFPEFIKLDFDNYQGSTQEVMLWCRYSVRGRHLQNRFLIEQLLQKLGFTDGQELIDVARESLSLVLLSYKHRDRHVDQHFDFEWIIMCYGVPVAGVLCLELLKQSGGQQRYNLRLPRSETIQNLSMFVAFLDWVKPGDGNYQLCQRMSTIISRVLDQVLEGPIPSQTTPVDPQAIYDFELPNDFPGWQDLGNINYLDTLDWVKAPWMESSQQ